MGLYELETLVWGAGKEIRLTEREHLGDSMLCAERKEPMSVGPSFSTESYVFVQEARIANQVCYEVLPERERVDQEGDRCGVNEFSKLSNFSLPSVRVR